jgi:hypothetical protein
MAAGPRQVDDLAFPSPSRSSPEGQKPQCRKQAAFSREGIRKWLSDDTEATRIGLAPSRTEQAPMECYFAGVSQCSFIREAERPTQVTAQEPRPMNLRQWLKWRRHSMAAKAQINDGEQITMQGFRPISQRERLEWQGGQPLAPKREQKPLDIGFWNPMRNQIELF